MNIETLRIVLVEYETMLARIPAASNNANHRIARGIYERLIVDTLNKLTKELDADCDEKYGDEFFVRSGGASHTKLHNGETLDGNSRS